MDDVIEWTALEFEPHEKSSDWYWIFGIVVVIGAIIAIVVGNTLFAILIILSGVVIGVYSTKHPDTLHCAIDRRGVHVNNSSHLFKDMDSFWIDETHEHHPKLLITLKNKLSMHISIPLGDVDLDEVGEFVGAYVNEEEQNESLTEQLTGWLKI